MPAPYLDCSHEVSDVRSPPSNRLVWLANDITDDDWLINLNDAALNEITNLATFIQDNPLQMLQRRIDDVAIPECRKLMARMKSKLDDGVGFAVLDRMPLDDFSIEILVEIYWLLGQCIGRPVAQKWNGQMIYDVHGTLPVFLLAVE